MRTEPRGWKVTATVVGCILMCGPNRALDGQEPGSWKVSAFVLEEVATESSSVRVWLGVTNIAKAPKVICVRRVWYSVYDENGPGYGGTADVPPAQSCGGDLGRHIVPADCSHYALTRIELPPARRADSTLTFQVDLVESDAYMSHIGAETSVRWRGTLADAIETGKRFGLMSTVGAR